MKVKELSVAPKAFILKRCTGVIAVGDICRRAWISDAIREQASLKSEILQGVG